MTGRGIVLYDYLQTRGGAERVTLELAHAMPGLAVGYGYRNGSVYPHAELAGLRCHDLRAMATMPGLRDAAVMHAFAGRASRFVADYDWALFSGTMAPLAVRHRPGRRNLYYCHTPPRFVYDLREHYLQRMPAVLRPALHGFMAHVKPRYEAAIAAMDTVVANSENVRRRLQHYLHRDAEVVYPPVDTTRFRWHDQGDYYVSLARHESLKRVDRIVEAFLRMPTQRLVVASGGSQTERLRRLAGDAPNIVFTSWLPDDALARLIGGARASIYIPRDEDFGLSPVESMAAGKPVIGVAEGGLLETVVDGETGVLLALDPQVEALVEAVQRMDGARARAMRGAAQERAQRFARPRFLERMRELVGKG